MTIKEARQELSDLISKENSIRHEKKKLKSFIHSKGADVNPNVKKIVRRNKAIYLRWIFGEKFTDIAARYDLSPSRIGDICRRVEVYVKKSKAGYAKLPKRE